MNDGRRERRAKLTFLMSAVPDVVACSMDGSFPTRLAASLRHPLIAAAAGWLSGGHKNKPGQRHIRGSREASGEGIFAFDKENTEAGFSPVLLVDEI